MKFKEGDRVVNKRDIFGVAAGLAGTVVSVNHGTVSTSYEVSFDTFKGKLTLFAGDLKRERKVVFESKDTRTKTLDLTGIKDPDGVPGYVWRLLEALLTGKPLDFGGMQVPIAVQKAIETFSEGRDVR